MTDLTYRHYGSPDQVATHWKRCLEAHKAWIDHVFHQLEAGQISLDTARESCKLVGSPISDQDMELVGLAARQQLEPRH